MRTSRVGGQLVDQCVRRSPGGDEVGRLARARKKFERTRISQDGDQKRSTARNYR